MHAAYARHVCESERESERCESRHEEKAGLFVLRQRYYSFALSLPLFASLTHSLTHSLARVHFCFAHSLSRHLLCVCVCVRALICVCCSGGVCEYLSARSLSLSLSLWLILMAEVKCLSLAHNIRKWHFLCRRRPSPPPFSLKLNTLSLAHTHAHAH